MDDARSDPRHTDRSCLGFVRIQPASELNQHLSEVGINAQSWARLASTNVLREIFPRNPAWQSFGPSARRQVLISRKLSRNVGW